MLYLKALNLEDAAAEYACLQDLPSECGFGNECYGISYEAFVKEEIPRRLRIAQGLDVPQGRVPDTYYFLWDGDRPVAIFKLRHYLNDALREGAGHIGYGVRRACRGRGYATRGLALAIEKAREIVPEDEIYFSVSKNNPASLRVQLKNGARIHHEDEQEYYTRIKL